jgi:Tfp pilus assembly protein PilF
MSLLLDALKRAAEEKLEKQQPQKKDSAGAEPAAPRSSDEPLSLDITDAPPPQAGNDSGNNTVLRTHRSDVLASELQEFLDHRDTAQQKVQAELRRADPYTVASATATPGQAAQLFESKRVKTPPPRKRRLLIISAAAVVVLLTTALFFYFNLRSLNQSNVILSQVQARPPATPIATENDRPAPATARVDAGLLVEQEETPVRTAQPQAAVVDAPAPRTADRPAQPKPGRLSLRKTDQQSLYSTLTRAYEAYNAGELQTAEIFYRQALEQVPNNRDALLGLAAIKVRQGDHEAALQHYRQLLRLDPRDDLALAGVAGLEQAAQQQVTAGIGESALKNMLQDKPDSAQLHFTLGNLYAGRQEWAKAQSAFFDAHRLDSQNPDYAYNLAVSLDHLQQPAAAVQYYRLALNLAAAHKAGFDTAQADRRLLELNP